MTPVDFLPPEFNSSCYLSLALVCSSLENRSLAAGNCAISCREKKKRCHVPFAIFLSERIGRLRASRLTRTQADLSRVTCERVAQKVSEALHRMNGSINLYPVLIIVNKNSGRVEHFSSNLRHHFLSQYRTCKNDKFIIRIINYRNIF